MRMKRLSVIVLLCATLLAPSVSWAKTGFVLNTTIIGTLQDAVNYGFCMARIGKSLQAEGFDCPADPLVTFDCQGNFASKAVGTTNFSGAQLAFVTGKTIHVLVDDTKKINGFCYVSRIDIL